MTESKLVCFHNKMFACCFHSEGIILTGPPWGPLSPVPPGVPGLPWKHKHKLDVASAIHLCNQRQQVQESMRMRNTNIIISSVTTNMMSKCSVPAFLQT